MALVDAGGAGTVYALTAAIPITLAGTVNKGDPIGYNSGWVQALGDASNGVYPARLVALESGVSGKIIKAAPIAVVGGARFTTAPAPGAAVYVKDGAVAGLYTEAIPNGEVGDLITVVGRSLDTSLILVCCTQPNLLKSG